MTPGDRLARDIAQEIETALARVGLMSRVFHRAKSSDSAGAKIERKAYATTGKKLQDFIGIRVVLYFTDDVLIAKKAITQGKEVVDDTTDDYDEETFRPTRLNVVLRMKGEHAQELSTLSRGVGGPALVDTTYEVQIRTILSEGWHEAEHDLRYKCSDDWKGDSDLGRTLNGVLATLETCDWSMLSLFDDLSHRHYRRQQWQPMLRFKFRLRFQTAPLPADLSTAMALYPAPTKAIFRADRQRLLMELLECGWSLPITYSNLLFTANHMFPKSAELASFAPNIVKAELERCLGANELIKAPELVDPGPRVGARPLQPPPNESSDDP